jgi:hypothetical protein
MLLRDLGDARALFRSLGGTIAGVGMTAFSRIAPAYFLDTYPIASLRKTADLETLRSKGQVFCLEDSLGGPAQEQVVHSGALLNHPATRAFLKRFDPPRSLMIYQSYPELESLAEAEGWNLLANPAALRARLAGRRFFREMLQSLKIQGVPGAVHPLEDVIETGYETWCAKMGPRFVLQLTEITQGGGRGTFFVRSPGDYERIRALLKGGSWRGIRLKGALVSRFVEGVPASMALCVTRHGVVRSRLQRQLIDLPYCDDMAEQGIFCGHAWGQEDPWPQWVPEAAGKQARSIGEFLSRRSYRGILGIDFVVSLAEHRVYPLEINPRLTGAFPMLSMLHAGQHLMPFEVFHILEFMNVDYSVDVDALNEAYSRPIQGSHLLVFLKRAGKGPGPGPMDAGLYEMGPQGTCFIHRGPALDFSDLKGDNQFIIVDGPPQTGGSSFGSTDPLYRLCRLLFPGPVLDQDGSLCKNAAQAVRWAWERIAGGLQ